MNIHIKSYGKGIPLVLFHGWGFDHQIWSPLIPVLQDYCQLILVDLPGFGHTNLMDWQTFKTYLLEFLPKKFAVAGWSMGGLYATKLAIEEPRRVLYLLNITSSPKFIAETAWPGVAKEVFLHFYENLTQDIRKTLMDFINLQVNKNNIPYSLGILPTQEGLESGLDILEAWDLRVELKSIELPTCYMFGRVDPITPIKTMHSMQHYYPKFKYVLFNKAAHMPFLSHPDLFVKEILEFIK